MTEVSFLDPAFRSGGIAAVPFFCGGAPVEGPRCLLSLRPCGSMRYRYAERNPVREKFIEGIESKFNVRAAPVELNHTKTVYCVRGEADLPAARGAVGDGIITTERGLMPCVTVADCVPIFLYDKEGGAFGIVHSGWKGTGIVLEALRLAGREFGAEPENFCAVIGPSIHKCCYVVDSERAAFFSRTFAPSCVTPYHGESLWNKDSGGTLYRLSLQEANAFLLKEAGVPEKNIAVAAECTACSPGKLLGSFRAESSAEGSGGAFTVMLAAACWTERKA